MLPWLPATRHCDIGSAAWVGFLFPAWPSWAAVGDLRHMVQFWAIVPEACPGTIRGQLRPPAVGRTLGRTLCSGRGQLGSGPPFCVVLGRSLSFSEHPFLHRLSDKVGLGNLEFLCIANVYSSGDSIGSEVYSI